MGLLVNHARSQSDSSDRSPGPQALYADREEAIRSVSSTGLNILEEAQKVPNRCARPGKRRQMRNAVTVENLDVARQVRCQKKRIIL